MFLFIKERISLFLPVTGAHSHCSTTSGKIEEERRKHCLSPEMTHNIYSDDKMNKLSEDL